MAIKISKKIKGYAVANANDDKTKEAAAASAIQSAALDNDTLTLPKGAEVIQMHEKVERPDVLIGSTYKIKSPLFEHALYVTINDIVLNQGTAHELRRPFEIFINSKNMDHFQWVVAITRIMSAVFRKGGDVTFLVEELKAVFDPRGGYFKAGGVYMPSIVAEIGAVVEDHMKMIGLLHDPELSDAQRELMAKKRAEYDLRTDGKKKVELSDASPATSGKSPSPANAGEGRGGVRYNAPSTEEPSSSDSSPSFPPSATLCNKCHTKAVIIMDGCATCLSCGHSKCG